MIALIVNRLFYIYSVLLVIYVLMSWIPYGASKWVEDIRSVLGSVCEPYLGLFRRFIPPLGMVDFSPVIAIIVLQLAQRLIVAIL
jgi:YggT family protein